MEERHKFESAVHLVLEQDNKVLLLRRFNTGYEDGNYSLVAGHIDGGEPAKLAMAREAMEEAMITIDVDSLETIHVIHRSGKDGEKIDFFMRARRWEGKPVIGEPHKCDDLSWFEINRLPSNTVPYILQAFEHIKKGNYYSEFGW